MVASALESVLDPLEEASEVAAAKAKPSPFRVYTLDELAGLPGPEYLIPGLVGPGGLVLWIGQPGGGKTFSIIDTICRLALGLAVFGTAPCSRPLTVFYATEEGRAKIHARFVEAFARFGVGPGHEVWRRVVVSFDLPRLFQHGHELNTEAFIGCVAFHAERLGSPFDITVLDTLSRAGEGSDENKASEAIVVMASSGRIQDATGATVIAVHHPPKNGEGPRGSSVYLASADLCVEVAGTQNPRKLICTKVKDGEPFTPRSFDVMGGNVSAWVRWLDASDVPERVSKAKAAQRQVVEILMARATSPERSMSIREIREEMSYSLPVPTIQNALAAASDDPTVAIEKVKRSATRSDGKLDRPTWHYWLKRPEGDR